ncbi:hypothetical protein Tco_0032941 [Tanacetum coccineum]
MRPPAITEPPSKRQRVERVSSQPASVPAATTLPADDPDSAGVLTLLSLLLGPSPFLSSIAGGINEFFLESDEEEQIGIYELLFLMMRFVDPRVKVETVSVSASSPPRSRRKHLGVRSDDFLWDKPVENRRRKYFTYLKELLPHVYHEDLLLLRRRMNRYFRLNPEVDVGLDLWRDVNLLCQSLHPDDVRRTFGVHKMNGLWVARSYILRVCSCPGFDEWEDCHSSPLYCRDVVVAGNIIQYGIGWYKGKQMSVLILLLCKVVSELGYQKLDGIHFPCSCWDEKWLVQEGTALELASPEQTATGKDMLNPLYGCDGLPKTVRVFQFTLDSRSEKLDWLLLHQAVTNSCCKDWKLLFFNVAACFVAAGYLVSAGTCFCCYSILLLREDLSRNLELTESKPIVPADSSSSNPADNVFAGSSSSIPADYVSAGHSLERASDKEESLVTTTKLCFSNRLTMSESMPTIPTQSTFTYPNPNPSASPSFTQDDTSDSFIPEPTQPIPTFTQTAFSQPVFSQPIPTFTQPAAHFQQTQPTQTQQYPNNVQSQQFQQFQTASISANNAKFPYLEKDKYEILLAFALIHVI